MEKLAAYIKSTVDISEEILGEILPEFELRIFKKGKFLLKSGHYLRHYYFVDSGGIRVFLKKDEKDITAWLSFENSFLTDIECLRTGQPSRWNFEAVEDTRVYAVEASKMEELYNKYPEWQAFGRKLWERAFLQVLEGMINHQTLSAEERYLDFISESDAIRRLPLKQISTFLGITPNSLSRIRKNIK